MWEGTAAGVRSDIGKRSPLLGLEWWVEGVRSGGGSDMKVVQRSGGRDMKKYRGVERVWRGGESMDGGGSTKGWSEYVEVEGVCRGVGSTGESGGEEGVK